MSGVRVELGWALGLALALVVEPAGASAQSNGGGSDWPPRIDAPAPPATPRSDPTTWEVPPDPAAPQTERPDDAERRRRTLIFDVAVLTAFANAIRVSDGALENDVDLPLRYTMGFGLRPRFFPHEVFGIGPYVRVMGRQTWGGATRRTDGLDYRLGAGKWWTVDVGPSVVGQLEVGPVWLYVNLEGGVTMGIADRDIDGAESDSDTGWNVAASAGVRWWPAQSVSLFLELGVAHHDVEHRPPNADSPIIGGGPNVVTPRFQSTMAVLQLGIGFGN